MDGYLAEIANMRRQLAKIRRVLAGIHTESDDHRAVDLIDAIVNGTPYSQARIREG